MTIRSPEARRPRRFAVAEPVSAALASPMISRFAGFTSRCTMPAACSAPSPSGERDDHRRHASASTTPPAMRSREHAAAGELHHEERASVVELADVVHRDDVGVPHAAKQLGLADEPLACARVVGVLRASAP